MHRLIDWFQGAAPLFPVWKTLMQFSHSLTAVSDHIDSSSFANWWKNNRGKNLKRFPLLPSLSIFSSQHTQTLHTGAANKMLERWKSLTVMCHQRAAFYSSSATGIFPPVSPIVGLIEDEGPMINYPRPRALFTSMIAADEGWLQLNRHSYSGSVSSNVQMCWHQLFFILPLLPWLVLVKTPLIISQLEAWPKGATTELGDDTDTQHTCWRKHTPVAQQ